MQAQDGSGAPFDEGPSLEGASFLLLAVSAKGVGLGRAMTAMGGAESVWWNPAGLGELRGGRFLLYRGDHPAAGEATAASLLLTRAPLGALGLSYQLMDVGDQEETDIEGNVIGTLTERNHLWIVSAATRIRGHLSLGLNAKLVQSQVTVGATATSFALDGGAQLTEPGGLPLRLGAMVAHAGPGFRSTGGSEPDPLPTRVRFAAAYELLGHFLETDELTLTLAAELEDRWRAPGSPATYLGAEFTAGSGDVLYLRAGYVFGADFQLDGASVGGGLHYERFELGLAKSLASSVSLGQSEPIHISFGFRF